MNRREMLASSGAFLGAVSLGGCLSRYEDVPSGDEQSDQSPTLADESFEVLDAGCGEEINDAEVSFEDESVVVTGTIPGANACYIAELGDVDYDPDDESLELTVVSVEREDAEVCASCIAEVEYEAAVGFEGGLPQSVSVVHEALEESRVVVETERE